MADAFEHTTPLFSKLELLKFEDIYKYYWVATQARPDISYGVSELTSSLKNSYHSIIYTYKNRMKHEFRCFMMFAREIETWLLLHLIGWLHANIQSRFLDPKFGTNYL